MVTGARHLFLSWTRSFQSSFQFYLLTIHFKIIVPSIPRHSNWPISLRFRHHNPVIISLFPRTFCMPRWSHFSWFDYLTYGEEWPRSYYFYSLLLKALRKVERISHTDSRQHQLLRSSISNFIRSDMCRTSGVRVDKRSWPPATR